MTGNEVISDNDHDYNRNLLFGCGALALLFILALCALIGVVAWRDRQAARYPGSSPISSHSMYKGLPREYRWDDTYLTTDNFTTVYNWYSINFDLGAEARAMERCTTMEGQNPQLVLSRTTTVSVCNTPDGQMIFVSRTTSLR